MKKKIIGIFICTLLIATAIPAVEAIDKTTYESLMEKPFNPLVFDDFDDEVPLTTSIYKGLLIGS